MTPHRLHIRDAARRLEGIVEDPIREAGVLLAIALGLPSRADIFTKDPTIDAATSTRFDALVAARAKGVPVAYLRGHTEFFSHRFAVGEGVLVPRPDTERLVEEALALLPERGRAESWTSARAAARSR